MRARATYASTRAKLKKCRSQSGVKWLCANCEIGLKVIRSRNGINNYPSIIKIKNQGTRRGTFQSQWSRMERHDSSGYWPYPHWTDVERKNKK